MRMPLGLYDYEKLNAIINGLCLSVLIVLYVFLRKSGIPSAFVLLIFVPIQIVVGMIIRFLWTSNAERTLLRNDVKYWNARRIAISLCFPFACTLAGVVAIAFYPTNDIATMMIIVLSLFFGTHVGSMVKIVFRYKLK